MILKKITRTLLHSLLILVSFTLNVTIHPGMQQPFDMFSPEGIAKMEQKVEEERARMSEEERAQFDNDVELLTRELEAMNPEELESFMNQVISGIPEQMFQEEPQPAPAPAPQPVPPVIAPKPEPAKPKKELKKQDAALARINSIINHNNSFLNKIARYIEFSGKLKKWSEQGKVKGWGPKDTWDSVKKSIENLTSTLSIIQEKDPKTNDYKYLNDLIDDETLYGHLGKLHDALSKLEPDIEIDDFGIEPVSRQIRYVIRKVLAEYVEAFKEINMLEDLNKIITKYEPTAKKYREEDEKLTRKALEDSKQKQQRRVSPTVVSGKGDRSNAYTGNYSTGSNPYDYYPYSAGYSPSSYTPSSYKDDSDSSSYSPPKPPSASSGNKNSGTATSQKDVKDKDEKTKDAKNDSPKSFTVDPKTKKINDMIEKLQESLTDTVQIIKDAKLQTMHQQILEAASKEDKKKIQDALADANDGLLALLTQLKKLKRSALNSTQKNEVQKLYAKNKTLIDETLESIKKISTVIIDKSKKEFFDMQQIPTALQTVKDATKTKKIANEDEPIVTYKAHSPYALYENLVKFKESLDEIK